MYPRFLSPIMAFEDVSQHRGCTFFGVWLRSHTFLFERRWGNEKQKIQRKTKNAVLCALISVVLMSFLTGCFPNANSNRNSIEKEIANSKVPSIQSEFNGDCGIMASAEMGSSIIGLPELTVSVQNVSEKEISAIQFYAVPYDVYGDEIKNWTRQSYLITDTSIGVGESNSVSYQFIEDNIKTVKLYVYSVYFADGTEWGNKDATKSTILNHGVLIEVSGESQQAVKKASLPTMIGYTANSIGCRRKDSKAKRVKRQTSLIAAASLC